MLGRHEITMPGLSGLGIEEQPPEIGRAEFAELTEAERAAGGFTVPFFEQLGPDQLEPPPQVPGPITPDLGPEEKGPVNFLINYYERFDGPFDFFWKNLLGASAIAVAGLGTVVGIKAIAAKRAAKRGLRGAAKAIGKKAGKKGKKKARKAIEKAAKRAEGIVGKAKKKALEVVGNPYSPEAKFFHIRTADPDDFVKTSFRVVKKRREQDPEDVQKVMVPKTGVAKKFHGRLHGMERRAEKKPFSYETVINKLRGMKARNLKTTVAKPKKKAS